MIELRKYLKVMAEKGGSDLFFSSHAQIQMKVQGNMHMLSSRKLSAADVAELAESLMSESQREEFAREMEMNFAHEDEDYGRFRVNVFRQRGEVAFVIRHIRSQIPTISELNLPLALQEFVMERSGLVLIVGATGSGKSTALASMLQYRNQNATGHILTIEDPVEFMHHSQRSLINQREVGIDTHSYANALKNAMREAPDVIMIGEIRDRETMEQAIRYSETGHLCLSTLHANNTNQALEHILNFFDRSDSRKLQMDLALNMRAVVSLRLVRGKDQNFIPAVEVLVNTPYVSELIARGEFNKIKDAIEQGGHNRMCTFDDSLMQLYQSGRISASEALRNADSRNNMQLKMRLLGEEV